MKLWKRLNLPKPKTEASKGKLSLADNEVYSGIEVPDMPFFVRLDGWSFHSLAKKLKFKQPYDKFFANCLVDAAKNFFIPFNPILCYIFSDEINLLFLKQTSFKRIEKIDSVFAGIFSAIFSNLLTKKYKKIINAAFDCRVIPVTKNQIQKYLIWRQAECFRNHNNSYAYWILRKKSSARAAAKNLLGMKTNELFELCRKNGIDLKKTPSWQRDGILIIWEKYKKNGYDPIRKKKVLVERRRPKGLFGGFDFRKEKWDEFQNQK